jgi:type IV pilus assembly protein PilB
MSAKLGEILVRENLVTPQQLREALDYQRTSGGRSAPILSSWDHFRRRHHRRAVAAIRRASINLDLFQIETT